MRSSPARLFARVVFIGFVILSVPVMALAVLYAEAFEPLRRTSVERLLSEAIDVEVAVRGPITISFDWEPTITIGDIAAVEASLPPDLKDLSAKSLRLRLPLVPLLAGSPQLESLVVDDLKLAIEVPRGGGGQAEHGAFAEFVRGFLRSGFADDFLLRNAALDYVNDDNGFELRYAADEIESKRAADGSVAVEGAGRMNGEPWKVDGDVDPPGEDDDIRKFVFAAVHANLTSTLAGTYDFHSGLFDLDDETVDMTVTATVPALDSLLKIYGIRGDLAGSGDLSGRLAGSLDALELTDLALKLTFANGNSYRLTGNVDDFSSGSGLGLALAGTFARPPLQEGEEPPIYAIGVTGFEGRIEGAVDGVLLRDFHIFTSSVSASLSNVGPITAERLYRDKQGRLGIYDVLVLAGNPQRPSVHVSGTVKDIISFSGVDLKGRVDFPTVDLLDLAAEEHAGELGHLSGDVAISDADGSLGIEHLSAAVADSDLLKLGIDLVFDDVREAKELTFATHLDIPVFKSFAAALGSSVDDVGRVKFDGTITGSDERIAMAGTAVVGETTLDGSLTGRLSDDRKPTLSGEIATALLHLSDLKKLASINRVYQENVDEKDEDLIDYAKIWETLFVELQIKVARIAGGGTDASNIQGKVTYLAGVIGLEPLSMNYLGGNASANGTIDTTGDGKTFALKGSINNLRIGRVLQEMQVSYPVAGALNATYDLSGAGNSMAQVPRSLNGSLSLSLRDGWIGTRLLDLTGMSLPAWLFARGERGNQATLVCAVAPFTFSNGRASTRALVFETRNVQVVGVGYIDFRADAVDLRFRPQALQNQFIKIAQPFAIQGKLGNPSLRLTGAPVAGAVTGVIAFPFNLLGTIVQPRAGTPGRVPCRVTQTAGAQGTTGTPAPATRQRSGPLGLGILGGGNRR